MAEESAHQCRYKLSTVIISVNSSTSYNFSGMDTLIMTADNFQSAPAKEIKQKLFVEYINKIARWDYCGISRDTYLACSDSDKREIISKYYFDMKSRSAGGKFIIFFCFSVRMHPILVSSLKLRDNLAIAMKDANNWLSEHCFYCKTCKPCGINSRLLKELNKKGFKTFNKHVKWWLLTWVDDLPVLKPHI